ncbi:amidase [Singulisphaera sp. PoT]|uniref:amidase n=1 Tax=Singulisphaera sp. PoT TaxID=3411797 RepID=UPI003BF5CB0B
MSLYPLPHETIAGVGRMLRQGQTTCVEVLNRCLDRIEEWEPRLKAWAVVDRAGAIRQAERLDRELERAECRGPLHGIPIGVKDIIDAAPLPSSCGFPPWASRVASRDSSIVTALRAGGAIILGKTVTTQFAWIDPPPTRNPWNLAKTPGGSSSGSAAAVAVGMCLGALGSQTGGSIIRPASYCGIAGLKPSYSGEADGVFPLSPNLDHVGTLARSAEDLGILFGEFARTDVDEDPDFRDPAEIQASLESRSSTGSRPPRLAKLRGSFESAIEPAAMEACERAIATLAEQGVEVIELPLPFDFEEATQHHRRIMAAEASAVHAAGFAASPDAYRPRIRELIEEGRTISATQYLLSRAHQDDWRARMSHTSLEVDAMVMPSTLGPAPDADSTGSPALNSLWSYVGSPSLTFPVGLTFEELPLGIQLVGPRWFCEDELIATAARCETLLRSANGVKRF